MIRRLRSILRKIKVYLVKYVIDRAPARTAIEKDIDRWVQMLDRTRFDDAVVEKLIFLLYGENMEEFRNLLYYRLGIPSRFIERGLLSLAKSMYKPRDTLAITSPSIGTGLVIMHGFGTVIDAERLGDNCLVFQDVVIGTKNEADDRPMIGNYVHISTGSKVLGKITIGDHAVIAANSVVTKDMPPNSLALGVPARIIREAGSRAEYIASGEVSA